MFRVFRVAVVLISYLKAVSIPHYSLIANTIQMVAMMDTPGVPKEKRSIRSGDTIMGRTCIPAPGPRVS